jgi:hypothetical protein
MKVEILSAHGSGRLYPTSNHFCYSFFLETDLTSWTYCGWKNYVNEKFQWNRSESNPPPSACSTVPQPTAQQRAQLNNISYY